MIWADDLIILILVGLYSKLWFQFGYFHFHDLLLIKFSGQSGEEFGAVTVTRHGITLNGQFQRILKCSHVSANSSTRMTTPIFKLLFLCSEGKFSVLGQLMEFQFCLWQHHFWVNSPMNLLAIPFSLSISTSFEITQAVILSLLMILAEWDESFFDYIVWIWLKTETAD